MFSFFFNNSKKKIVIILLITVVFGLFLINVENAKAFIFEETVKDLLTGIFSFFLSGAQLFTGLVAKLFTEILNFGFKKMDVIYNAWTITRDIVNMFFILGLVVISFATILRIEPYRAKALLPKLIIIAILINFSFLACGIIIDASQVMANYFIDLIQTNSSGHPDVGAALIETLGVTNALKTNPSSVPISRADAEMATILNLAFSATIIIIAGFVLLIGAILLFVRIGALWILIILVPFAWFLGVFPSTKHLAKKWWDNFLKYAFFAPIYLFFIYLVLKIGKSMITLDYMGETPETLSSIGLTEMLSNWNLLFYYVFLIILLSGAPVVATSMGIYGSKTVIGGAKKVLKGAGTGIKRYTGRKTEATARRRVLPLAEKISSKFTKIPALRGLSRVTSKWAAKGSTKINEIAKKQPDVPEKEIIKNFESAKGKPYERMAWIQKLSKVAKTDKGRKLVNKNLKKYKAMGGNAVKDVISNDLTFARDDSERKIAANIRTKTGKTQLSNLEANDINSVEAMRTAMGTKEFISACEKMPDAIKDTLTNTLLDSANASETPISRDSLNQRKVFADLTHDIEKAFTHKGTTDVVNLEKYINILKPQELGKIKGSANLKRVAKTIDSGTALSAKRHFSKEQADTLGSFFPEKVAAELKKNPSWASHIP